MSRLEALIWLIVAIAGFAVFAWLSYKFAVYIFRKLNENRR